MNKTEIKEKLASQSFFFTYPAWAQDQMVDSVFEQLTDQESSLNLKGVPQLAVALRDQSTTNDKAKGLYMIKHKSVDQSQSDDELEQEYTESMKDRWDTDVQVVMFNTAKN